MTEKTDIPALIAEVRRWDVKATPGPWVRGIGSEYRLVRSGLGPTVAADCGADNGSLIAAYRTAAPLLAAECEEFRSKLEHTQYWYSVRLEHLHRWAHTKLSAELRTEYFSIVANGHEDGAPPTYAQKMNVLSHARDKADAECSRLQAEVTQLRAERDMPCAHRLEEERLRERVRVLDGLLTRIVKYAIEDHAMTPGSTRLGRAVNEARAALEGSP